MRFIDDDAVPLDLVQACIWTFVRTNKNNITVADASCTQERFACSMPTAVASAIDSRSIKKKNNS